MNARRGPFFRSPLAVLPSQRLRRIFLLRHVPLVAALETLAVLATRLGELHLGTEIAALRTLLGDGFVPHDEITIRVRAGIERRATLARPTLDQLAAVFRAEDARWHRARSTTFRERAAAEELTAATLTNDHRRATDVALVLRHHRLRALALEWSRVLARFRMVLAGEEGPEEAAARLELSTAIRTTQLCHLREIVSGGDQST